MIFNIQLHITLDTFTGSPMLICYWVLFLLQALLILMSFKFNSKLIHSALILTTIRSGLPLFNLEHDMNPNPMAIYQSHTNVITVIFCISLINSLQDKDKWCFIVLLTSFY
mmetsp:Transcript_32808/g.50100  ORF Transcript_32808/g.50100 Transcript_32808/m.50100 type:complete len:111 (+) Transcript_32808:662-994(+)